MAMPLPLSGELSRRRLGTQSGDMMRQARSLQRQGFGRAAEAVALGSAKAKMGEGGIQSAESNKAKQGYAMRLQGGLLESQRRATLGGGVQNGASGVQGAAPANNLRPNPAPALPSPTPTAAPSPMGTTPAKPAGVPPPTPSPTVADPAKPAGAPPTAPAASSPAVSAPAAGVPPLLARPAAPRMGMIDGKPAADVLAEGRGKQSAPVLTREQDRAGVLSRMRAESGGNTSATRLDVLKRINNERAAAGKAPIKFTNQEIADADLAAKGDKVPYNLRRTNEAVTGTPYSLARPDADTLADTKIAALPGKTSNDMRADAVNQRLGITKPTAAAASPSPLINRAATPAAAPAAPPQPKVARPVSTPAMTSPESAAAGQREKGATRQKQVIEETKAGNARAAAVRQKESEGRKANWDRAWNEADKSTPDWQRGTLLGRLRRQLVARTSL